MRNKFPEIEKRPVLSQKYVGGKISHGQSARKVDEDDNRSCVHLSEHAVVDIFVPAVGWFIVEAVLTLHLDIVGLAVAEVGVSRLLVFRRERRNWRDIRIESRGSSLGSAVAAAEKSNGGRQICLIAIIAFRSHRPASTRRTPLAMVRKAMLGSRSTFRKDRLVGTREQAALIAKSLGVPVRMLQMWRWSRLSRTQFLIPHV